MHAQVDFSGRAGQAQQRLRLLQAEINLALVYVPNADGENARHAERLRLARGTGQAQRVADAQAEIGGQTRADEDFFRAHGKLSGNDVGIDGNDVHIARWLDAEDGHCAHRIAALGKCRARYHGGGRLHVGHAADGMQHRGGVVDAAKALRSRVDARQIGGVGRGRRGQRHQIGRLHHDLRLAAQGAVDDIALQPGNQGGDEHDHRRAHGDADENEQRLRAAIAQKLQGDIPGQAHGRSGSRSQRPGMGRSLPEAAELAAALGSGSVCNCTRSPGATLLPARTDSPEDRPETTCVSVSPCSPSLTCCACALPPRSTSTVA